MNAMLVLLTMMATTAIDNIPFYADKHELLQYQDNAGAMVPITDAAGWAVRRAHALAGMQSVMGALPTGDRSAPPAYEIVETVSFPAYTRHTIRYVTEAWDVTPAFLFIPKNATSPRPAMLCLHPTSPLGKRIVAGEGEKPNRNYAQELAERGYVVLAPDYPGFGDYVETRKRLYEEGYVSCTMKGIWNHLRGVDLLERLAGVDGERIGCIGHSLGGHNALFLSAFDPRIKVTVTSCGFTTFAKYMEGDLTGWTHDGYMPRIASVYDKDPARMPFDFTEILGSIAPRAVFINAPVNDDNFEVSGVRDAVAAAEKVFALYEAGAWLRVVYPDAGHDFPDPCREQAYDFIGEVLRQ